MDNEKKQEVETDVVAKNTRENGSRRKRGKRVPRDEGQKEDDMTKDESEQFAKE